MTTSRPYNQVFAERQLKIILSDPDHPLSFWVDREKGTWLSRKHGAEFDPAMQVGHATSLHSGAAERLTLEDADLNQLSNWTGERYGVVFEKPAILIGGVPVDLATAQQLERMGKLPAGTCALAPSTPGWSPRYGLEPDGKPSTDFKPIDTGNGSGTGASGAGAPALGPGAAGGATGVGLLGGFLGFLGFLGLASAASEERNRAPESGKSRREVSTEESPVSSDGRQGSSRASGEQQLTNPDSKETNEGPPSNGGTSRDRELEAGAPTQSQKDSEPGPRSDQDANQSRNDGQELKVSATGQQLMWFSPVSFPPVDARAIASSGALISSVAAAGEFSGSDTYASLGAGTSGGAEQNDLGSPAQDNAYPVAESGFIADVGYTADGAWITGVHENSSYLGDLGHSPGTPEIIACFGNDVASIDLSQDSMASAVFGAESDPGGGMGGFQSVSVDTGFDASVPSWDVGNYWAGTGD